MPSTNSTPICSLDYTLDITVDDSRERMLEMLYGRALLAFEFYKASGYDPVPMSPVPLTEDWKRKLRGDITGDELLDIIGKMSDAELKDTLEIAIRSAMDAVLSEHESEFEKMIFTSLPIAVAMKSQEAGI